MMPGTFPAYFQIAIISLHLDKQLFLEQIGAVRIIGSDIHQSEFTPEWGFSDLGFTFWNWSSLTDNFIADFK